MHSHSRSGWFVRLMVASSLVGWCGWDVRCVRAETPSRAALLAQAGVPAPGALPTPGDAVALPDDWDHDPAVAVAVRLSQQPAGQLTVRRVGKNDGRLYLEIRSTQALAGAATVSLGGRDLGERQLNGSLWLSLKPRIGKLTIRVTTPDAKEPIDLPTPTTLVEVRGRRIFLNAEPFLMKGATGQVVDQREADYVHGLGLNLLRGLGALPACERYGFMSIASINTGPAAPKEAFPAPDAEFEQAVSQSLNWYKDQAPAAIANPNTLILQLGNERTGAPVDPPGSKPLTRARRHVSQFLAAARNAVKPLAPMLPVGYANQDLGYLAPDCMDVYMHNSFLNKDRYDGYPWDDFLRWQGCLPPDGPTKEGRPFVNSEFGANRYLCQAYREGPNNPFLERVHAWNLPCQWAEFMEHGTVGGSIYCLHDLAKPVDQGCSCFGILTSDGKPKLACWEVNHMWRDFDVAVDGKELAVSFKREYWARDCRLTVTPAGGKPTTVKLDDFAPGSRRAIDLNSVGINDAAEQFHWRLDFTTHSGLIAAADGACPTAFEEAEFLGQLKVRDTYPFLGELFDTQVLTADGKPAPRTLAEMTNSDGVIPVALRKRNGVTYLLLITREKPEQGGPLHDGITIDVAFGGKVEKVDDMTGQPLPDAVDATPMGSGLRLRNVQAAKIPGAIGQRSKEPFKLPIYRIVP